jgi:hypothetical protein
MLHFFSSKSNSQAKEMLLYLALIFLQLQVALSKRPPYGKARVDSLTNLSKSLAKQFLKTGL